MKKVTKVTFAAVLFGALLFVTLQLTSPPNPFHEGKRISHWLTELAGEKDRTYGSPAGEALKRAGSNAAPRLIQALGRKDSRLAPYLGKRVPEWLRKRIRGPADSSFFRADCASLLGDINPTSPEIVRALTDALRTDVEPVDCSAGIALRRIADRDDKVTRQLRQGFPELIDIKEKGALEHLAVIRAVRLIRERCSSNEFRRPSKP